MDPSDRKPQSCSTRCSEGVAPILEPVTASEHGTAGDPFPDLSMYPLQGRHRRTVDRYTDSRMPVLARAHHLDTPELDVGIQQE